jgi:mRNA-degrading endonuclease RelE of RelBE toxin-antitoxin system
MSIPDFAKVTRGEGFSRDFKKLIKRYRSLEEDLKVFIRAQLFAYHKLQVDNHGLFPIDNLGIESPKVYKAKKFACKSLKGRGAKSGIRVIYAYIPENDEIYLIEIYFKADKENEDRDRIKELFLSV